MNRVNVTVAGPDGECRVIGHFDYDKARRWDDADHDGNGSRGTGRGEAVLRTSQGRWVRELWSNWQGEDWQHEYISAEDARDWFAKEGRDDAIAEFFGELPEEEDRRPGRPPIGGGTHVNLGGLKPRVAEYAAGRGVSLGEAVRQLVEAGLEAGQERLQPMRLMRVRTGEQEIGE